MKDKWNVHELYSMLVQEEIITINYVNHPEDVKKNCKKHYKKAKRPLKINDASSSQIHKKERQGNSCHFCKKTSHFQQNCPKHKAWFEKKGKPSAYVCFKSNLTEVPYNTWWIDSGCTTNISNTMQGFLTIQAISPKKKFFFMGNRMKVPVEAVGTYRLILDTGHHLDLLKTLYVPSISRNLISLSKLDVDGYSFKFGNGCLSLFKYTHMIGSSVLYDGLYKLNPDKLYDETFVTLHHNVATKCSLVNECSTCLWHKRLGHISKEIIKWLINNNILSD